MLLTGRVDSSDPTYVDGNMGQASFTTAGRLRVDADVSATLSGNMEIQGNVVTLINRSGTITSGGTAQTAAASNAGRKGFSVQNVSGGDLWWSTLATAIQGQPSHKLPPNALYETPLHAVPTGAISIIGGTTGQAFTMREW